MVLFNPNVPLAKKLRLVADMCQYKENEFVLETLNKLKESLSEHELDRILLVCVDVYGWVLFLTAAFNSRTKWGALTLLITCTAKRPS